ncbi:hypothetical protein ACLOJK_015193 [Asimina triloba]
MHSSGGCTKAYGPNSWTRDFVPIKTERRDGARELLILRDVRGEVLFGTKPRKRRNAPLLRRPHYGKRNPQHTVVS